MWSETGKLVEEKEELDGKRVRADWGARIERKWTEKPREMAKYGTRKQVLIIVMKIIKVILLYLCEVKVLNLYIFIDSTIVRRK